MHIFSRNCITKLTFMLNCCQRYCMWNLTWLWINVEQFQCACIIIHMGSQRSFVTDLWTSFSWNMSSVCLFIGCLTPQSTIFQSYMWRYIYLCRRFGGLNQDSRRVPTPKTFCRVLKCARPSTDTEPPLRSFLETGSPLSRNRIRMYNLKMSFMP